MTQQVPAPPRHARRHLTREEWRDLLAAAQGSAFDRALLHVLYDLCLRAHEPGQLTLGHARELHRGQLYAPRGKGSRSGWIEVAESTRDAVGAWLGEVYPDRKDRRAEHPLFPASRFKGGRADVGISRFVVYRTVRRLGQAAYLHPDMAHPHAIRHGFIMHVLERGLEQGLSADEIILYLAPRVGHATARTTVLHYVSETRGAAKLIRDVVRENLEWSSPLKCLSRKQSRRSWNR